MAENRDLRLIAFTLSQFGINFPDDVADSKYGSILRKFKKIER